MRFRRRFLQPRHGAADAQTAELALKDFNAAIRLNENDATHFASRGFALDMLGRRAEARSDYNRALELNPDDRESRAHLRSPGAR
jgi:Flp pilus assembly protein TadD